MHTAFFGLPNNSQVIRVRGAAAPRVFLTRITCYIRSCTTSTGIMILYLNLLFQDLLLPCLKELKMGTALPPSCRMFTPKVRLIKALLYGFHMACPILTLECFICLCTNICYLSVSCCFGKCWHLIYNFTPQGLHQHPQNGSHGRIVEYLLRVSVQTLSMRATLYPNYSLLFG